MATATDPLAAIAEPYQGLMRKADVSINALATATLIPFSTLRRKLIDPEQLTMGDLLRIAKVLGVGPAAVLPAALTAA